MEPALTNIGIVLPERGLPRGVRELTRRDGTLLVIDETHTICAGPGGCTAAWDLDPDFVVIGKPIGGGIPVAAYGMTDALADRLVSAMTGHDSDVAGSRRHAHRQRAGARRGAGDARHDAARRRLRADDPAGDAGGPTVWPRRSRCRGLDWTVQQLGCRAEYWFCPPPRDGAAAAAAVDDELDAFMHLWALNRGVLLTPFHNMALMSPAHAAADVDRHTEVFTAAVDALTA